MPQRARNDASGEALWRFSLALYARPGVADALIRVQDRAGCDVNLILFGVWLGVSRGRVLAAAELAATEAAIAPLAGTVARLRRLRRQLKGVAQPDLEALRRRILGLEIVAERRVQDRLAGLFPDAQCDADRPSAAWANLALTLGDEAGSPEADVLRRALASLIRSPTSPNRGAV